jgi:hypothetical protein
MKLLFDWCHLFKDDDWNCKLGLDWYGFEPIVGCRKDLEGSKGFTVVLYAVWWRYSLTWIHDYAKYSARMNYRHSDTIKRISDLKERIEAKRAKKE